MSKIDARDDDATQFIGARVSSHLEAGAHDCRPSGEFGDTVRPSVIYLYKINVASRKPTKVWVSSDLFWLGLLGKKDYC